MGAYFPGQDPSGSSSGSGVSSSLGLALAALGTETDGSILSPSDVNNLVGIKPTVGLTSRDLIIPISQRQDTCGPMARTVKDAAYVLAAIAGKSPYDNYTDAIPFDTIPDYVAACQFNALSGKRIGVPRNLIGNTTATPIITAFDAALNVLRAAGATIVEHTNFTGYEALSKGNYSSIVSLYHQLGVPILTAALLFFPQQCYKLTRIHRCSRSTSSPTCLSTSHSSHTTPIKYITCRMCSISHIRTPLRIGLRGTL